MDTLATTTPPAVLAMTVVIAVKIAEMIVMMVDKMIARSIKDDSTAVETLEVVVVADVIAPPLWLTSHVKSATKRDTMPKIDGPDAPVMMTTTPRKYMPLMG
jgi:hypothetical protein